MACQWCGDTHGVDQLCQRAQRGMTRRSFCFLFGAGVAGALLPKVAPSEMTREHIAKLFNVPLSMLPSHTLTRVSIYGGPPGGPNTLIGTFPANDLYSITCGASIGMSLHGNVVVTGRTFAGETVPNLLVFPNT